MFSHHYLESQEESPNGLFSKMSPDCLIAGKEEISPEFSQRWMNSGMFFHGEFLMGNTLECHKDAEGCLLSEVIDRHVPFKYFLGKEHLQSILTRSEKRGKKLPLGMESAIQNQICTLSNMPLLGESHQPAPNLKDIGMTGKHGTLIQEEAEMLYVRRLTPWEYEKIQGFPPGWTDLGTEQ